LKKAHALHNEHVCLHLHGTGKYNDWVVTTAFYAALHYVQHEIFPLQHKGTTYHDFSHYYSRVMKPQNNKINKHAATIELVKSHIAPADVSYRALFDASMNARYSHYNVSPAKAAHAKALLDKIKGVLKK